jgi:hypothetical protein
VVAISEWFYTAPFEDIAFRRGDPLGLRPVAEEMARALAPGLSNQTVDGRWLSILCWALQQSYSAWRAYGVVTDDGDVGFADEMYSWLRPLELLWIARTVALTDDQGKGRQLRGVRPVRQWVNGDVRREPFGFAFDAAYRRYRFTGAYGAYRVALRSLPGLTVSGDGWHLDRLGWKLAEIVKGEVQCSRTHQRGTGRRPVPERYWQREFKWQQGQSEFLPTLLARPRPLAKPERELLRLALFAPNATDIDRSNASRRRAVIEAAAGSSATARPDLFADVARKLGGRKPLDELALLSPFCALADAGVAAMNHCWAAASQGHGFGFVLAADVLARRDVAEALGDLVAACKRWRRDSARGRRRISVADALADSMLGARGSRKRQFQALERHHNQFGAGLKWLALEGNRIIPRAPIRDGDASVYRFRIAALCRLGVQAGIIASVPQALRGFDELGDEDEG